MTAVILRHGIHLSAQSVPLAMAAVAPERLALPVAVGHEALPSQSRLVQSVTVRAEIEMGSADQAVAEKLGGPEEAEVDSIRQLLGPNRGLLPPPPAVV